MLHFAAERWSRGERIAGLIVIPSVVDLRSAIRGLSGLLQVVRPEDLEDQVKWVTG